MKFWSIIKKEGGLKLLKRQNGYFYIAYSRHNTKSLDTQDETEAGQFFDAEVDSIRQGKIIEFKKKKDIKLIPFKEEYIKKREEAVILGDITEGTKENDERALNQFIACLGNPSIRTINQDEINRFKTKLLLLAKGKQIEQRKGGINVLLRSLRSAFTYASGKGYIDKNPFFKEIGKKSILFDLGTKKPKFFREKEIQDIENTLKLRAEKTRNELSREDLPAWEKTILENRLTAVNDLDIMVHFYLYTGLRRSELIRLQWQDIDLDTNFILVRKTKTKKERYIPITNQARNLILNQMGGTRDIGIVFSRWSSPDYISRLFTELAKESGVYVYFQDQNDTVKKTLHSTRHSFGSHLAMSGAHQKAIQKAMGHADIKTTDIYMDIEDEVLQTEIKKLKFKRG